MSTVFVIGAGASCEVGLPVGEVLKGKISQLLNIQYEDFRRQLESGDRTIQQALSKTDNYHRLALAALHIKDALPLAISIDNFIDMHRDNEDIQFCGKLAIVRSILMEERLSSLFFDEFRANKNINFGALNDSWYPSLFKQITEGCVDIELEARFKSIKLIIFNYDRCVEHFLYHAIQTAYGVSQDKAIELINHIEIYHPYGSVGALPWLGGKDQIIFGGEPRSEELLKLAERIKTFTEGIEAKETEQMRVQLMLANRLVFLGFAFHKINMQLLSTANIKVSKTPQLECYATVFDESQESIKIINQQIRDLYQRNITVSTANLTCKDLFAHYRKRLEF